MVWLATGGESDDVQVLDVGEGLLMVYEHPI